MSRRKADPPPLARAGRGLGRRQALLAWLSVAALAVAMWPHALDPAAYASQNGSTGSVNCDNQNDEPPVNPEDCSTEVGCVGPPPTVSAELDTNQTTFEIGENIPVKISWTAGCCDDTHIDAGDTEITITAPAGTYTAQDPYTISPLPAGAPPCVDSVDVYGFSVINSTGKGHIALTVDPQTVFAGDPVTLTVKVVDYEGNPTNKKIHLWIASTSFTAVIESVGEDGELVTTWTPVADDEGEQTVRARVLEDAEDFDPDLDTEYVTVIDGDLKLEADPVLLCENETTTLKATLKSGEEGVPVTFDQSASNWSETEDTNSAGVASATSQQLAGDPGRKYTFTASTDSNNGSLTSNSVGVYVGSAAIPGNGGNWPDNDKLLIGTSHKLHGTIQPSPLEYHWSYDTGGSFVENGTHDANLPVFTAPEQATTVANKNKDMVSLAFGYQGDVRKDCAAERALNITRPLNVALAAGEVAVITSTESVDASKNTNTFKVIDDRVDYDVLDQFDEKITQSDRGTGNAVIRIKECLTFTSPKPNLQTWLQNQNNVGTGQCQWENPQNHGKIGDNLVIPAVPVTTLQGGPPIQNGMKLIEITSHKWYVSVDDEHEVHVADNVFTVTVKNLDVEKETFDIDVKYEVNLEEN